MGSEDFDEEEARPDDDAAVGYVEVGPVVVVDADLEEVDDVVVDDAVIEIAQCAAKDECKGDRGNGEVAAYAPEHAEENDNGDDGEGDEDVADRGGRGVFSEHAERRAGVVDVGDAKDAGDDGVGLAVGQFAGDDVFGDAVDEDDQSGDGEHEATPVFRFCFNNWRCDFLGRGHQACGSVGLLGGAV